MENAIKSEPQNTQVEDSKLCDVCGRNVVMEDGSELTGMKFYFTQSYAEKYHFDLSPYQAGREYKICFPCLLSKLGVKP